MLNILKKIRNKLVRPDQIRMILYAAATNYSHLCNQSVQIERDRLRLGCCSRRRF